MFASRSETRATLWEVSVRIGKNGIARLLCATFVATVLSSSGLGREPWKFVVTCDSRGLDDGIEKRVLRELVTEIKSSAADFVLFPGDQNDDCYVDFLDFAILVDDWLSCGNPLDASCD